jgi:hypothetical protein
MRRLVLLLLLLLVACAPYPAPATDPRLQAANALSTLTYATQVAAIERERAVEATRAAGVEAARMQEESALISTRAAGTVQALQVQLTAGAATLGVDLATSDARSTMDAARMTATPAAATEAAVVAGIERDRLKNQARAEVAKWVWAPFAALAVALALWALREIELHYKFKKSMIAAQERERSLYPLRDGGVLIYNQVNGEYYYLTVPKEERVIMVDGHMREAPQYMTPSVVLSPPANTARDDMLAFLDKAIAVAGEDANYIPRWDKLGYGGPGKARRFVKQLEAVGAVHSIPDRGTYIHSQYRNLYILRQEIDSGSLRLSPALPGDAGERADRYGEKRYGTGYTG